MNIKHYEYSPKYFRFHSNFTNCLLCMCFKVYFIGNIYIWSYSYSNKVKSKTCTYWQMYRCSGINEKIPLLLWYYTCFNAILPNHPPTPSPTESKRQFYTSVSLLLSLIQGYRYHLSKFHIYALVYCIGLFLSGLLHSI